jgi:hypothetical protein
MKPTAPKKLASRPKVREKILMEKIWMKKIWMKKIWMKKILMEKIPIAPPISYADSC